MEERAVNSYILYVYYSLNELRKIQQEREIYNFIFGETKKLLDVDPKTCIDITSLIYYLQVERQNVYIAYTNLSSITDDTTVIVDASIVDRALEVFPLLFSDFQDYFLNTKESAKESKTLLPCKIKPYPRQKVYKYNNVKELDSIIEYATNFDIPLATFSRANGELKEEFERFNRSLDLALVDLTSVSCAIEGNKSLIYLIEQFLSSLPNVKVIVQTSEVDTLLEYFPLFFSGQESVCSLIPELLPNIGEKEPDETRVYKITDLNDHSLVEFIEKFNHNLIGHKYFKQRFQYVLKNFITLNRAREQPILSIFLYGVSGIGKTEVARLLASGLMDNCYLAKINFQNYSSQDSLNSLIGSPSGYIGCKDGELREKVQKSKAGVLLCDEFEKTTRPVFSFFLELLEEGKFTDSLAREYDMDGYVVVFTSNIQSESEYKKCIPPELQTRFDLVCEFEEPTAEEKTEFLDLLLEKAYKKYPERFSSIDMTDADKQWLYNFDYSGLTALRDIKRVFNYRLMDFFSDKNC